MLIKSLFSVYIRIVDSHQLHRKACLYQMLNNNEFKQTKFIARSKLSVSLFLKKPPAAAEELLFSITITMFSMTQKMCISHVRASNCAEIIFQAISKKKK